MTDRGQMFTLEGIIAAVLLLVVSYMLFAYSPLTFSSSSGISAIQLKQYGDDILRVLDNSSSNSTDNATLESAIKNNNVTVIIKEIREMLPKDVNFNLGIAYCNYTNGVLTVEKYEYTHNIPTSSTVTVWRYLLFEKTSLENNSILKNVNVSGQNNGESQYTPVVVEVRLTLWQV